MIEIRRTFDAEIANEILNHPDVFDSICDDANPGYFDSAVLLENDSVFCYLAIEDDKPFGVFIFIPWQTHVKDVHSACLKSFRGKKFLDAAKLAIDEVFSQTNTISIITTCPAFNRPSVFFAKMCGMSKVGTIPQCYIKNEKAHDLILLQINRGGVKCQ